jgi:hypothetical protein
VLARQALYHFSHAPSPFCFRCFFNRVSRLCPGWPRWRYKDIVGLLCSWDDSHAPTCPAFIDWKTVSKTFCPGWPQTTILLISAFQVVRITGVSHCAWPMYFLYELQFVCVCVVWDLKSRPCTC